MDETRLLAWRWLHGASVEALAGETGTKPAVVKRRIKWAKAVMPDLPWEKRPAPSGSRGSVRNSSYPTLTDGVSGIRAPGD